MSVLEPADKRCLASRRRRSRPRSVIATGAPPEADATGTGSLLSTVLSPAVMRVIRPSVDPSASHAACVSDVGQLEWQPDAGGEDDDDLLYAGGHRHHQCVQRGSGVASGSGGGPSSVVGQLGNALLCRALGAMGSLRRPAPIVASVPTNIPTAERKRRVSVHVLDEFALYDHHRRCGQMTGSVSPVAAMRRLPTPPPPPTMAPPPPPTTGSPLRTTADSSTMSHHHHHQPQRHQQHCLHHHFHNTHHLQPSSQQDQRFVSTSAAMQHQSQDAAQHMSSDPGRPHSDGDNSSVSDATTVTHGQVTIHLTPTAPHCLWTSGDPLKQQQQPATPPPPPPPSSSRTHADPHSTNNKPGPAETSGASSKTKTSEAALTAAAGGGGGWRCAWSRRRRRHQQQKQPPAVNASPASTANCNSVAATRQERSSNCLARDHSETVGEEQGEDSGSGIEDDDDDHDDVDDDDDEDGHHQHETNNDDVEEPRYRRRPRQRRRSYSESRAGLADTAAAAAGGGDLVEVVGYGSECMAGVASAVIAALITAGVVYWLYAWQQVIPIT